MTKIQWKKNRQHLKSCPNGFAIIRRHLNFQFSETHVKRARSKENSVKIELMYFFFRSSCYIGWCSWNQCVFMVVVNVVFLSENRFERNDGHKNDWMQSENKVLSNKFILRVSSIPLNFHLIQHFLSWFFLLARGVSGWTERKKEEWIQIEEKEAFSIFFFRVHSCSSIHEIRVKLARHLCIPAPNIYWCIGRFDLIKIT